MGVTTMKTTSLRIIGALLVLSVLWGMVPSVRADDTIDHANEIGRYQAELWQETVKGQEDQQKLADYLTSLRPDGMDQAPQPKAPVAVPQPEAPVARPMAAPQAVPQELNSDIALTVKNGTNGRLDFEMYWAQGAEWRKVTLQPGETTIIPCKAADDVGYACYYSGPAFFPGRTITGYNSAVTPGALRSSQTWTFALGNNPLGQDNQSVSAVSMPQSGLSRVTLVRSVF